MSESATRIFLDIDSQRKLKQILFPLISEIPTLGDKSEDIDEKEIPTGDIGFPLDKDEVYLKLISVIRTMHNDLVELTKQYNQLANESKEEISDFKIEIKKLNEQIERLDEGRTSRFKIPEAWLEE